MKNEFVIRNLSDIEAIEKVSLADRVKEKSTFELIEKGAGINPDALAISFLKDGASYETPVQITYKQLIWKIRQAANMFHDLGVSPRDVVTYILPNLPQTHFTLWGAEAVGIANPINPMLEASAIRDICKAAGTKVLVTLGDLPGTEIWKKIDSIRREIPSLKNVICVMGKTNEAEGIYGFEEKMEKYPGDRLTFDRKIDPDDIASLRK